MKENITKIERLIRYTRGEMIGEERRELESLISNNEEMAALFGLIKALQKKGLGADLTDITYSTRKLSKRLFAEFQKGLADNGAVRGITVFDSKMLPLPGGVRPASVDTRRIKYKIGDFNLHISMYPISNERYEIIGQIIGTSPESPVNVFLRGKENSFRVSADEFLIFRFIDVPLANYTLQIKSGRNLIGLVEIEVQ